MKKLQIMGGGEIIISDEEAEKIMSVANDAKFVALASGDFINVSSISSIVDYKGIPFIQVNNGFDRMEQKRIYESQNGGHYYVNYENKRVPLRDENYYSIEYFPPEKVEKHIEEIKVFRLEESKKKEKERKEKEAKEKKQQEERDEATRKEKERWDSLTEEEKNQEEVEKLKKRIAGYNKTLRETSSDFMKDYTAKLIEGVQKQIEDMEILGAKNKSQKESAV